MPQLGKIFTVDKNAELYAYIFTFYGNLELEKISV